jgi:uncharacterized protein (DUF952 family)
VEPIFHLTTAGEWAGALAAGSYERSTRGRSLGEVGFIHCSFAHQVERIADFLYAGEASVLLLVINPAAVPAEVRHENLEGGAEQFPHIYGPLPVDAVVDTVTLNADAAGRFGFPF